MARNRLIYLPLGGAGEIGMNMYVYGYGPAGRERLVVVDAGVAFPNMETSPGIDLIMPDTSWLRKRAGRIEGIFLTHAHEDHLGAVGHLLRSVDAPVYARRFTSAIARFKLEEAQIPQSAVRSADVGPPGIEAGPFRVRFVPVSHSIPEASALVIDSPAGRIVHTGDFKIDASPVIGSPFDHSGWREIGEGEIAALVCDSTNIFVRRKGRSESSIGPALAGVFSEAGGLVAATTFASNVARVLQIARAGQSAGRSVVLLGRAMNRMIEAALESRVIADFPRCLAPESALGMPREKLLLLTTGSQGEHRSATFQLSFGKFRGFRLVAGDTVLLSSKTIPGNELAVARVVNRFSAEGVKVIEDHEEIYHVSGHANRPDVTELQRMLSPKLVVPMHGENRHLVEHAALAESNGFRSAVVRNGQILDILRGAVSDEISVSGIEYIDGGVVVPSSSGIIRDRLRLARNGSVAIAVSFGRRFQDFEISVKCAGLELGSRDPSELVVLNAVEDRLRSPDLRGEPDDEVLEREITIAARRAVMNACGKKPVISVLLTGV